MIRCRSLWLVCGALLAALSLPAGRALAQDQAAVDKLVQMNKKALEDFDTLEWDAAKRALLEALVFGKKSGLDNHPVMARTYVHLGAVYITGLKDRQKGLQSFARALEIDPSIKLSRAMSTPDLEEAFADASRQAGRRGGGSAAAAPPPPPPPPSRRRGPVMESEEDAAPAPRRPASSDDDSDEPDLPLKISALDCPTPDETPPEKAVVLRCAVASNLPVSKVFLLYREPGKEEFAAVDMQKTPKGWFQGKIPKKAVTGTSIQFYFEGRNGAGKPVVSNGRADSPNLLPIREEGAAEEAERAAPRRRGVDTEENPLDDRESSGPRRILGKVDRSKIGLDVRYGKRRWWIGLGAGSGYGYAKGNLETVSQSGDPTFRRLQDQFAPGLGWAGLLHVVPEIGYMLTPDIAVSIEGRHQWIPQDAQYAKYTARGAHSILARLLFYTRQSQVRFFGSVMGGGGEGFRFVLFPDEAHPMFKDTIKAGPVLAGVGGGVYYELSKPVSLVVEVNGLAGFPNFSMVADLNMKLEINFY